MTDVYTPAEGSIPALAIAHLRTLPDNTEVLSSELAVAIGAVASSLTAGLQIALKHRLIKRRGGGRGGIFYSVSPLDAFDADDARGGQPMQRTVDASTAPAAAKRGPASVFELGGPTPPPSSWVAARKTKPNAKVKKTAAPRYTKRAAPVAVRVAPTPAERRHVAAPIINAPELSCAMFNTGDLVIEAPGTQPLRLSARQTADLVAYLQRFHNAAAAA